MNVCIVVINYSNNKKLVEIAEKLAAGISRNGHRVDIIDGSGQSGKKISFYDYIAVGPTSTTLFSGKIPSDVHSFLGQCGLISGKRSFAFLHKGGLRKNKSLRRLMNAMEHEGMFLKNSNIISRPEEAEEIGKRLHIN